MSRLHPDQVYLYGCSIGDNSKVGSSFVVKFAAASAWVNCKIQAFAFIPEGASRSKTGLHRAVCPLH